MKRTSLISIASVGIVALVATPAGALPGVWLMTNFTWSPGGDDSAFALRLTDAAQFGVVGIGLEPGVPLSQIDALSFSVYYADGSCGGGSPRAALRVDLNGDGRADGNVHGYAGPQGSYSGCPNDVWLHEDLLDGEPRFEAQALGGGYGRTLPEIEAALPAGAKVVGVNYIWDSAWMFSDYRVHIDDVRVNGAVLSEPGTGEACSIVAINAGVAC